LMTSNNTAGGITHLLALEDPKERTALTHWLKGMDSYVTRRINSECFIVCLSVCIEIEQRMTSGHNFGWTVWCHHPNGIGLNIPSTGIST
jgi:hypothetical protein